MVVTILVTTFFISCAIGPSEEALLIPQQSELLVEGESILMEMITAVNQTESSHVIFEFSDPNVEGTVECFANQFETRRCEQNFLFASGDKQLLTLFRQGPNDWIKQDDGEWLFLLDGLKDGYEGLNDLALVASVTAIIEQEENGTAVYEIAFEFEPESLLRLILNSEELADQLLSEAQTVSTQGKIVIETETNLPLQEQVQVKLELPDETFQIETIITYEAFDEPFDIPLIDGEFLFQQTDLFFTHLSEGQIEEAYRFFSTDAQKAVSFTDFESFIQLNIALFENLEDVTMGAYEPNPDMNELEGEFDMIIVDTHYQNETALQFQMIFVFEDEQWRLLRFDELVAPSAV